MCSLQHSLKRNIVVKGNCCLQVTICLEDKIVPWTRSTVLAKKYICGKMKYILLWSSAFLSFSFYDHFYWRQTSMGRLGNENRTSTNHGGFEDKVFPQITSNILAEKEYNMWKDAMPPLWCSASLWMTLVFEGNTWFLQNDVAYFVQAFHSYERAYCMHTTMTCVFQKNTTYTQGFYFIAICLFCINMY